MAVTFPDLFGEIPVTLREIELWLYKVPRLGYYRSWRDNYIRDYRVIDKIRNAKARGTLAVSIPDELCEFCGQTLAQELMTLPETRYGMLVEIGLLKRRIGVLETLLKPGAQAKKSPHAAGLSWK